MAGFEISLDLANRLFAASNVALLIGIVLALMGTMGVVTMDKIRERYADERIAANEAETARANAEAAASAKEAAQANLRTEELRAQFAWRTLTKTQFERLTESLRLLRPRLEGKLATWVYNDEEPASFASQIIGAIEKAGYQSISTDGQSSGEVPFYGLRVDNRRFPDEAQALLRALAYAGIEAELGSAEPMVSDDTTKLYLYVSVRPPPKR